MSRRMLRWTVAIDDQPHSFVSGFPLHVAAASPGRLPWPAVEFWAEEGHEEERTFLVVGTGHEIPAGAQWRGTCERTPDGLVWHLYELRPT